MPESRPKIWLIMVRITYRAPITAAREMRRMKMRFFIRCFIGIFSRSFVLGEDGFELTEPIVPYSPANCKRISDRIPINAVILYFFAIVSTAIDILQGDAI